MKPYLTIGGASDGAEEVAIIRGGDDDGEIIYLCDGDDKEGEDKGPLSKREMQLVDMIVDKQLKNHPSRANSKERLRATRVLQRTMMNGGYIKDPILKEIYSIVKSEFKRTKDSYIDIVDGEIELLPRTDQRQTIYVAAPSGSGKSFWTRKYARNYNRMFPKNPVYLFSKVDDDDSLKGIKNVVPILLDMQIVDDPIEPSELDGSLCIFDDTDTIKDKDIRKAIISLKDDLLETGRHNDIYVLITSHLISNYRDTRTVLNESQILTVYPSSGSAQQIRYVLKNYWGLDKEEINKVLKLNSRAVSIRKNYPMMCFSEHSVFLLGTCMDT